MKLSSLYNFQKEPKMLVTKKQLTFLEVALSKIKKHEGLRLKMYKCSEGYNTIGYGFNLDANEITEEIAEMLLMKKFDPAVRDAKDFAGEVWEQLSDARKVVLIDMAYNLGRAGLLEMWTLQAAVREKRYKYAAMRMRSYKWYKQVGHRGEELAKMMETGIIN